MSTENSNIQLDLQKVNDVSISDSISKANQEKFEADANASINAIGSALSRNTIDDKHTSVKNDFLDLSVPNYGVQEFINERALWQKGIHNLTGEPGWFYFKIFFNFKDPKGLFGGILTNEIPLTCALRYLYGIRKFYKISKIEDRILSLARFAFTLSYINSISPWFFIGLNGVNRINAVNIFEPTKEKSIDIICNGESVDMRLNTLLDMYKYACYDEINQKEIIPQNLRKFDMQILIMNAPIKYFQTAMMTSGQDSTMSQIGSNGSTVLNKVIKGLNEVTSFINGSSGNKFNYKTIQGTDNSINDKLSFQLYELKNCEIDPVSFEGYAPSSMNNSQFFRQGLGSIKINYDRAYKVSFNEWTEMMFGTLGVLYDKNISDLTSKENLLKNAFNTENYLRTNDTSVNSERIKAINKSIYNTFFNKDTESYKGLIDFSEAVIQDSLINVDDPYYLGNIGENMDINSYEDLWKQTKKRVTDFFKF